MQEEIEQKSAALMINGTKFSLRTLKTAAIKLLAHRQNPSTSGVKHPGWQTHSSHPDTQDRYKSVLRRNPISP